MYAYVYDSNTQIDPFGLTITHLHHTIPRQVYNPRSGKAPLLPKHLAEDKDIIGKKGAPNRWAVPADEHRALHSPKSDISIKNGGDYNARWQQELALLDPDKDKWTKQDIFDIRDKLTKEFEIDKYKPSCH